MKRKTFPFSQNFMLDTYFVKSKPIYFNYLPVQKLFIKKMQSIVGKCWWGIFLDAYKYSSNYLLLSVTLIIASLFCLWIYEKPQFCKLFKWRKHSILRLSPIQNETFVEEIENQSLLRTSNTTMQKRSVACKEQTEFGK